MSKVKYKEWVSEDALLLLSAWVRNGAGDAEIAERIGISLSALREWKKKYPDISEAFRKGKDPVDIKVENALLENAISGSITAQIFWLKNRKPAVWQDKPRPPETDRMMIVKSLTAANEREAERIMDEK